VETTKSSALAKFYIEDTVCMVSKAELSAKFMQKHTWRPKLEVQLRVVYTSGTEGQVFVTMSLQCQHILKCHPIRTLVMEM
jgi:hypothetical protein